MIVIFDGSPLPPSRSPYAVDGKSLKRVELPKIERGSFPSSVHHLTETSTKISEALHEGVQILVLRSCLVPSLICRTVSPTCSEDELRLIGEIAINLLRGWESSVEEIISVGQDLEEGVPYHDGSEKMIRLTSEPSRSFYDLRRIFTIIDDSKEVDS